MLAPSYTIKGIWAATVAAAFLLVIAFAVVQTVRLEGFKLWPFKVEGSLAKVERLEDEIAAILKGQEDAEKAQQAVNGAATAAYKDIAERIDNHATAEVGSELAIAERFIAVNRVRCPTANSSPGGAGAAAQGVGAGDPAPMRGASQLDDAVAVPANDINVCTANTVKAEAGRSALLQLEALTQ